MAAKVAQADKAAPRYQEGDPIVEREARLILRGQEAPRQCEQEEEA